MRKQRKKTSILYALLGLSIALIVLSGGYLIFRHVILPVRQANDIQQLQGLFQPPSIPTASLLSSAPQSSENDANPLKEVQQINPDICGWIRFDSLPIDYPIVKTTNNSFYLTHDYKKQASPYGAIFMDFRCTAQSQNISLHGHHMNDGSMFASPVSLTDYQVYEKNKTFTTWEKDQKTTWEILSIFRIQPDSDPFFYLQPDFQTEEEFLSFVEEVKRRSLFAIPASADAHDRLMTLSTCSYEKKGNRTVVVAKQV